MHHEAGVPMSDAVAVHADTTRLTRQFPRPHHRNGQAASQTQPATLHGEAPPGVVQARQTALAGLELPAPLTLSALGAKVAQRLLLGHHRAISQPVVLAPPAGKRIITDPIPGLIKPRNRLIPQFLIPWHSMGFRSRSLTVASTGTCYAVDRALCRQVPPFPVVAVEQSAGVLPRAWISAVR
jgi:hypothetical protein